MKHIFDEPIKNETPDRERSQEIKSEEGKSANEKDQLLPDSGDNAQKHKEDGQA